LARLNKDQKEDLLAEFHTGQYSNNELAKRHNVSHTTVNKMTKGIEPKHKEKVSTISTMRADLSTESFKEVSAVEKAIEEKTKHIIFFQNSALKNQQLANNAIKDIDEKTVKAKDLPSLETHSRITQRNKETVLGKDKVVEITNTNAIQNNKSFNEFYDEED
jgi:hypothetical protein